MLAGDYSVADAAATCGIPGRTVRYMCSKGEWQEYSYRQRVGKREEWRIQKAAVDAWREKHNTVDAEFQEDKPGALVPMEVMVPYMQRVAALEEKLDMILSRLPEPQAKRAGLWARCKALVRQNRK